MECSFISSFFLVWFCLFTHAFLRLHAGRGDVRKDDARSSGSVHGPFGIPPRSILQTVQHRGGDAQCARVRTLEGNEELQLLKMKNACCKQKVA